MKFRVSRRSRRIIALALLPALLLRALTPAGFMPMHGANGGIYLAFCPGIGETMLPPAATDGIHHGAHALHDHAAMHDHSASRAFPGSGDQPAPQHHDLCPYALSAGPALAYSIPEVSAPAPRAAFAPTPDYPSVSLPTIERAQSARAPPAPRIA